MYFINYKYPHLPFSIFIITNILFQVENILLLEQNSTLKSQTPYQLFLSVAKSTKNKKIDLNSIKVNLVDKGVSSFSYNQTPTGALVKGIVLAYSEETDKGSCPACESIRKRYPNHKVVKSGTFGKNRKYEVIVLLPTKKPSAKKTSTKKPPTSFKSIGPKGLQTLKKEERFIPYKYNDGYGNLTIGYGTLVRNYPELNKVNRISQPKALEYVSKHMKKTVIPEIHDSVRVNLNQNQFDALCLLIYNIGETNFKNSNVLKYLNIGNLRKMRDSWKSYYYSGGKKSSGLVRRRNSELNLFFGKV